MNEDHMALDPSRIAAQVVSGVGFRCRYNYYSKAGGERINDSSWFMGYSRNWISNWGWYVCSRNWSDDSRFNWFRDCKPYF